MEDGKWLISFKIIPVKVQHSPIISPLNNKQEEMLTIEESSRQIRELFEQAIRKLVLQNYLAHIRTGHDKRKNSCSEGGVLECLR